MKKGVDYVGVTVSFFVHDGQGNFVLTKRSKNCRDEHGKWDFGGGSLDPHTSVEETLRREVKEELCADVLHQEFLGYRDIFREQEGVNTHWLALFFKVRVDPAQVANGEPHKFDDIGWFTLDTLPAPLHSATAHDLELYGKQLRA